MPSREQLLEAALAVKCRECSALRKENGIMDLNPWSDRALIAGSDLELGRSLNPRVSVTEDGLLIELAE